MYFTKFVNTHPSVVRDLCIYTLKLLNSSSKVVYPTLEGLQDALTYLIKSGIVSNSWGGD